MKIFISALFGLKNNKMVFFAINRYFFSLVGCRSVFGVVLKYGRINLNKRLNK